MTRTCDQCETEFEMRNGRQLRCGPACMKVARKASKAIHAKTPEAKAKMAAQRRTPAGKATQAKSDAKRYSDPANRAKKAETHKSWAQTDPGREALARRSNKRRALKMGCESDGLTYHKLDSCVVCYSTENLTEEHILALANGGGDTLINKTTMCQSCNSSKGAHIDYRDPGFTAWIVERRIRNAD